ncbi:MAG: alpha/beta hydrolase [Treponema sp.]|nr:alpha/beta hydrolase [Treponema sp.]
MNAVQITVIAAASIIAVIFIILSVLANKLLDATFVPSSSGWKKMKFTEEESRKTASKEKLEKMDKMEAEKKSADHWLGNTPHEDLQVTSFDGLKLHGFLLKNEGSHKYALIIHGYRGRLRETSVYGRVYHQNGWNVVLPENRASGMSGGKFLTMGALEKKDVVKWIEKILEIDKEASIILHGESMGAATVMMTLGENLPQNVKAAIEDCGYTSVWNMLRHVFKDLMKKSPFPMLNLTNFYSKIRFGFSFKKASAIKAVSKAKVPLLIFHGGSDDLIPNTMAREIYVATASKKDWFIIPGAGHCMSVILEPDVYWSKVWEFLSTKGNL